MTRFDIFVRTMILKHFSLSHLELSVAQEVLLQQMIDEIYQRKDLLPYHIEERVKQVVEQHRTYFYSLA